MRFAFEGLDEGIMNFEPDGREPEPVFVFCLEVMPPVPLCLVTLFFIVDSKKMAQVAARALREETVKRCVHGGEL